MKRLAVRLISSSLVVLTIVLLLVVVARGPAATPTLAATPTPAPGPAGWMLRAPEPHPKRGGIVKAAWGATTSHFDLHQGAFAQAGFVNIYNQLVYKNIADGYRTIAPDLATDWKASSDGLVYTFNLRDGVKYSDGTPFSSADVVASFKRIIWPPQGVTSVLKGSFEMVDKVEAVGRLTVRFTLKHPSPYFVELTSANTNEAALPIYSKKCLDENNNDVRKVMCPGTGPFVLTENKTGEYWLMNRNPNYWNPELPYVDAIQVLHVQSWADRGTAVLTGQADFSWNVLPQTWEEGNKKAGIGTALAPSLTAYTVVLNNQKKPFNDPRVRLAIHLAVNRQQMGDLIKSSQQPTRVARWIPRGGTYSMPTEDILKLPGYRPDKTEDIAQAKKLMAEAGYADGFDTDLVVFNVAAMSDVQAPGLQDQLKRTLNIRAKIRVVERAFTAELYRTGDFGMNYGGPFDLSILDPTPLWSINLRTGGSSNLSRYSNPEFDKIVDQLNIEQDAAKRQELVSKGMDLLDANPPFLMLGSSEMSIMYQKYVKGIPFDNLAFVQWGRFETVWLDK